MFWKIRRRGRLMLHTFNTNIRGLYNFIHFELAGASAEAGTSKYGGLCAFCGPRIYDISKLQWKKSEDSNGNTFLELPTEILTNGDLVLKPFKDEKAFGRRVDFSKIKYSELPLYDVFPVSPVNGIHVLDTRIEIEYYRTDELPGCPKLTKSANAGCAFCDLVSKSAKWQYRNYAKHRKSTITLCKLSYHFDSIMRTDGVRTLMLSSLRIISQEYLYRSPIRCYIASDFEKKHCQQLPIRYTLRDPDILAPSNISFMKSWIEHCETSKDHALCQGELSTLPFRLLDIGATKTTNNISLVEMDPKSSRKYVALSYCWGQETKSKPFFKTSKSTVENFKKNISWSALPGGFKLVINLVRSLGLRYVWIDSLCIIQDDREDWNREAAKMCEVYRNAFLTIVTCSATSPHDNIQFRKSSKTWHEIPWSFPPDSTFKGKYMVGWTSGSDWRDNPANKATEVGDSVWNSRGWTFQEYSMSRRILYLAKTVMYWECLETRHTEKLIREPILGTEPTIENDSTRMEISKVYALHKPISSEYTMEDLYKIWCDTITQYTTRNLTVVTDSLAALAGLAKTMAGLMILCDPSADVEYIGGIWKGDILRGIMWSNWDGSRIPKREALPKRAAGPSWLWSSFATFERRYKGRLYFTPFRDGNFKQTCFRILKIQIKREQGYGYEFLGVKGTLTVKGQMIEIPIIFKSWKLKNQALRNSDSIYNTYEDDDYEFEIDHESPGSVPSLRYSESFDHSWTQEDYDILTKGKARVFAMRVTDNHCYEQQDAGLLLIPTTSLGTDDSSTEFRRVGRFVFDMRNVYSSPKPTSKDFSPFKGAETFTITIV